MNAKDKEINRIIMNEIGLEIGSDNKIYDQDTGEQITIGGISLRAPDTYGGKDSMEFDPHNNRKQMRNLFEYFLEKNSELEEEPGVVNYYDKDNNGTTGKVECRRVDNTLITSKSYMRDSLKYTDIMIQMNGGDADLDRFDTPIVKETVKKKKG